LKCGKLSLVETSWHVQARKGITLALPS